jgi:hypothetical protein
MAKRLWTLRLTAHMCDNTHYLYKYNNGRIQLTTKGGMCEALSNISGNAAEFEMALESADTATQASAIVKRHATYIKASEAI